MGHAPDNLIKEESGAGGACKSLIVESVVGVPSGIGSDGAEEALFNGDADRAPDRHLTTHKERLKSVLGVKEATAIVNGCSYPSPVRQYRRNSHFMGS